MTVATPTAPHRLTWEAFIELPEELLHDAELHDGVVVYLAVEILSPSTPRKDLMRKPAHYFSVGAQELWLADTIETEVLPGFSAAVAELLAPAG